MYDLISAESDLKSVVRNELLVCFFTLPRRTWERKWSLFQATLNLSIKGKILKKNFRLKFSQFYVLKDKFPHIQVGVDESRPIFSRLWRWSMKTVTPAIGREGMSFAKLASSAAVIIS